ncbi:helix-turn-helix domain-containing protein [Betaproteobacteria bacterium LSUCC0115]|nr:helix-turn-helix domain-containing protein [Burkholderiales bacterium LSUCC0115]
MKTIQIKAAWNGHSDCLSCGIRQSALFSDIPEDQFADFHRQVDDLEFPKDAAIFHQGDSAEYVFTLRTGLIKIVLLAPNGEERTLRVIQPGALAGLDAITTGRYGHTAVALGAVKVCRLPISLIKDLDAKLPALHKRLMEKWTEALHESESWFAELNTGTAEQRLARFLIKLSQQDGGVTTAHLFRRDEMGSMLGVTLETISRRLSTLKKDGVIQMATSQSPTVTITNMAALKKMAGD